MYIVWGRMYIEWGRMYMKKTGGKKSRWTVPFNHLINALLCNAESQKKVTKKVPILKKKTLLCLSGSYYSERSN